MEKIADWLWTDYEEVGSTNDVAKDLTNSANEHKKYVITTRHQSNGRGRRGRNWVSLDGNLFMSMATEVALQDFCQVVFVVSLSLLETIKELSPTIDVQLKWPNDVLVQGCKISGILLEKGQGDYLVIGMGVNIKAAPDFPDLLYPTTSLQTWGIQSDRISFLKAYLRVLDANWQLWQEKGFAAIRKNWLNNAKGLGTEITVHTHKEDKEGIFESVDDNGALLLKKDDKIEKIYAGDVFYLRPNEEGKKDN